MLLASVQGHKYFAPEPAFLVRTKGKRSLLEKEEEWFTTNEWACLPQHVLLNRRVIYVNAVGSRPRLKSMASSFCCWLMRGKPWKHGNRGAYIRAPNTFSLTYYFCVCTNTTNCRHKPQLRTVSFWHFVHGLNLPQCWPLSEGQWKTWPAIFSQWPPKLVSRWPLHRPWWFM